MKLFEVNVYQPLDVRTGMHTRITLVLTAYDAFTAVDKVRAFEKYSRIEWISKPILVPAGITRTHYSTCTPETLVKIQEQGQLTSAARPKPPPKVVNRAVGPTQRDVLVWLNTWPEGCTAVRMHAEHVAWVHTSISSLQRILDSLAQRCLVNLVDGVYTINPTGLEAINTKEG